MATGIQVSRGGGGDAGGHWDTAQRQMQCLPSPSPLLVCLQAAPPPPAGYPPLPRRCSPSPAASPSQPAAPLLLSGAHQVPAAAA